MQRTRQRKRLEEVTEPDEGKEARSQRERRRTIGFLIITASYIGIGLLAVSYGGETGVPIAFLAVVFSAPFSYGGLIFATKAAPSYVVSQCPSCGHHNHGRPPMCARCGAPLRRYSGEQLKTDSPASRPARDP